MNLRSGRRWVLVKPAEDRNERGSIQAQRTGPHDKTRSRWSEKRQIGFAYEVDTALRQYRGRLYTVEDEVWRK